MARKEQRIKMLYLRCLRYLNILLEVSNGQLHSGERPESKITGQDLSLQDGGSNSDEVGEIHGRG